MLSRREKGTLELLCISLRAGDEKALLVFSSEMLLAQGFLRRGNLDPEWRVREAHSGGWSRCYSGPVHGGNVDIAQPLPGTLKAEEVLLNLLDRGRFLDCLIARG